MNLLPLLIVSALGFGLSCLVFIVRARFEERSQEMRSGPQSLRSGVSR
jgi:hypothetical protein